MSRPPPSSAPKVGPGWQQRTIAARLEEIGTIRHWVGAYASALGFEPRVIHEIQVAVSEALSNVILHAYATNDGPIVIELSRFEERLAIRVQDWGAPFVPGAWRPPDLSHPQAGGYGVMLMQRYTDELCHRRGVGGSNLVMMTRRIGSPARTPDHA